LFVSFQYGTAKYCEVINDIPEPGVKSCLLEGRKTIPIACETCLRMVKEIHGLKNDERIESELSWNGIVFGEEKTFSGKLPLLRSSFSSPSPLSMKVPSSVSMDETNSIASVSVNSAGSNNSSKRGNKKK
jgi:hypothetical protein